MGDKSPRKPPTKKPAQTLKQRRAAKKTKRDEANAPLPGRDPRRGG